MTTTAREEFPFDEYGGDWSLAFDLCREKDRPIDVRVWVNVEGDYEDAKLFPSGVHLHQAHGRKP